MRVKSIVIVLFTLCITSGSTVVPRILSRLVERYIADGSRRVQLPFPTMAPSIAEDATLTTPQLIEKYGYEAEVHYVTTKDGYILELHRISGGQKFPPQDGKTVVFLLHGLLDSSAGWVLSGPNQALGFLLADSNYDVWLGNNRGNRYSTNHTVYNAFGTDNEQRQFWSFSWHEIGYYDVPAMVDYVLIETRQRQLQYIGHSQGTTAFFVMLSEKPEYNEKIEMMHAFAPIAFLSNVISPPVRVLVPFVPALGRLDALIGLNYIASSNEYMTLAGRAMCRDRSPTQILCENLFFLIMGYTSDQLNATLLPVIVSHVPDGSSTNQMFHYGQLVSSGHFRQFDYGDEKNQIRYNRSTPPDYNLKNVEAPVAIYHAQGDWLSVTGDVENLVKQLPNVIHEYLVPHANFNHIDFLWGIDVKDLLYGELFRTMAISEL